MSKLEMVFPRPEQMEEYHLFLNAGYRRYADLFYRAVCNNCNGCVAMRLEVSKFRISKSQRRTLNKNQDIEVRVSGDSDITREKLELYMKYKRHKHDEQNENNPEKITESFNELVKMHDGYPYIIEMDYYLDGKLVGVGIVDEADDALSSNYFYYDTDILYRRPGIFSILSEIRLAEKLEKRYYYLGYFIKDTPKMSYKINFRPHRLLIDGEWVEFGKQFPTDL
jgi:arginine-tRNA-protein transferase